MEVARSARCSFRSSTDTAREEMERAMTEFERLGHR
jgi:hypothetical protein